jgi:hypothetical protein
MRSVITLTFVVLAVVSCQGQVCTAIGAEPGVTFQLGQALTDEPVDVRVCVEETCVSHRARAGRWEYIFVRNPSLTEPQDVAVSVQIGRPNSKPHTYETTVQVRRVQPNGPGCDPVVYQGAIELQEDGLHQVPRP